MTKILAIAIVAVLALSLLPAAAFADKKGDVIPYTTDTTYGGNGLPSGAHYNLNIIAAPQDKNPDAEGWTDSSRHTMFVNADSKTTILMTQDTGFAVLDANGTDGEASFQLDQGRYEVYLAAVGKPDKSVTIIPGATFDDQSGDAVFLLGEVTVSHHKKPVWERVTGMFLVTVTIDDGTTVTTYHNDWVFSIPELQEYWWDYDNHGCKLTKVRFYKVDSIPEEDIAHAPISQ